MNDSTRSKRVRQRPKTKKIRRHQDQPLLWPDRVGPVFANRQVRVHVQQRGKITPYGGVSLAHDLAMRLELDRDINRSIRWGIGSLLHVTICPRLKQNGASARCYIGLKEQGSRAVET